MKFVVDCPEDCDDVEQYLREFPQVERSRVLLMPQGTDQAVLLDKAQWLIPYCQAAGMTFCPRMHIEWYGMVRGT